MSGKKVTLGIVVLTFVLFSGACGNDGGGGESALGEEGVGSQVDRVIEIETSDQLRFDPSEIEVQAGETIEFKISNVASSPHEFVLGPAHEHSDDMQHGAANATGEIEPGGDASVVWSFPDAGETAFACHIDDHDKAGMIGTVTVSE